MRISVLGLLLCPALCLAQPPTGHMGTITVNDVEVTSGSEVSSEHLQAIRRGIEGHSNPPSEPENSSSGHDIRCSGKATSRLTLAWQTCGR